MQFDRLERRDLITLLGGVAAAWPLVARAQQPSAYLPRICSIHTSQNENSESFFRGLRDAGYVDGQNVRIDARFHGTSLTTLSSD